MIARRLGLHPRLLLSALLSLPLLRLRRNPRRPNQSRRARTPSPKRATLLPPSLQVSPLNHLLQPRPHLHLPPHPRPRQLHEHHASPPTDNAQVTSSSSRDVPDVDVSVGVDVGVGEMGARGALRCGSSGGRAPGTVRVVVSVVRVVRVDAGNEVIRRRTRRVALGRAMRWERRLLC